MNGLSAKLGLGLFVLVGIAGLLTDGSRPRVAHADHTNFVLSTGIYRIPYVDGTNVTITGDHHTHSPVDRIDMVAGAGTQVVAAASGTIRAIVDFNGNSPGAGNGLDAAGNPHDNIDADGNAVADEDGLEHSCQDVDDSDGNSIPDSVVPGLCQQYNNYVWIEHPNGEWTKYTHFGTGTVTALNWAVGDWVEAGEVLGLEGDVGRASGPHLHFEVGLPDDPTDLTPFSTLGGFMVPSFGDNLVPTICDITDNIFVDGDSYTANPCDHDPPTADAGGPYVVNEGSQVQLDGTGSNDPEDNILTYVWDPDTGLDNSSLAQPTYTAVDDSVNNINLTVYHQIEALWDQDSTTITVLNVSPSVTAVGDTIDEGGTATVSATFTDPGTLDTHTANIDWGDGSPLALVLINNLASGVTHVYGDNGTYTVTVTVTDDDGGAGQDMVDVVVSNLNPVAEIDVSDAISFPGGDYLVVNASADLTLEADGEDEGSDDLIFDWSFGTSNTYFNNGVGPDPLPSPAGTFRSSQQTASLQPSPFQVRR